MKALFIIALSLIVTLPGCAHFKPLSSPEAAAQLDENQLCRRGKSTNCNSSQGCKQDKFAVEEIKKRGLIQDWEWPLIEQNKIKRGMSECGLIASWGGLPKINKSVGSWGVRKQYVYKRAGNYVYVRNGVVTSWQSR